MSTRIAVWVDAAIYAGLVVYPLLICAGFVWFSWWVMGVNGGSQ